MSISISTATTKSLPIPTTNFNNHPSPKLFHLSFPPSSLPSSLHHHKPSNKLSPLFASPPPHDPPPSPENQLDYPTLTRQAVSEFLLQLGISHEDAVSISSNSHKYNQMLKDSVLELEELDSWRNDNNNNGGGSGGDGEEGFVGFKEKVIRMAKEKGDNGKVAFLESVGLSLSSAINVARYMSGEPLPALINKVKYMKEILFCGSNGEGFIGKNARRMMRHLSIPVDDDVQQTLAFFEKVGAMDKDVGKMLLKYPWILSTSILENYKEILLFFDEEMIPKLRADRAIRGLPHLLGCSTSKLKLMVEQIGELRVRNKKLGQVIAKSPQLLLRKPQEFLEVVSFLEDLGFDNEDVGKILARCPELFAASIEKTLKKKVEFLNSIGVSIEHLPRVINKYPEFLVSDVERTLLPRMSYLMEIGLSRRDIAFMVRRFSPLLGYSIGEVFQPKIDFLINTMDKPLREVGGLSEVF
ncbi:hypothetical protein Dsin_012990 [Dipteronia sinensis]|uniref:Mitochondrial transcription termination factor n=1 Tax=Dipteronia sinensis TaxID=43782 RepID=A0AAE0AJX1_9ROSI|nr:hypothetical protein Dsin_012990 [Dipteronia sinensis]